MDFLDTLLSMDYRFQKTGGFLEGTDSNGLFLNTIQVKQPAIAVAHRACSTEVFPHPAEELGPGTASCTDTKVKLLSPE